MQEAIYNVVCQINTYLSNYILVFMLIAVGLWFSIKTRFVQIRYFKDGMKKVFGSIKFNGEKQASGMTSFQALATAIAAQVGTGNIVGASGAILTKYPHEFPFLKCITQFCTREGMKCFRTIMRWHSPSFLLSKDFSVKKV